MSDRQIHVFGVRHLSPTGAWHLLRFLDEVKPKIVLIEGASDATPLIADIVRPETVPPIAILAYTDTLPVRTFVCPFARYSPEYQAMKWAAEHKIESEFIDLPSDYFLGLYKLEAERRARLRKQLEQKEAEDSGENSEELPASALSPEREASLYERIAHLSGEPDYSTYWERRFEHNFSPDSYRLAAFEFGKALRDHDNDTPEFRAESLVREAYMRRRIEEVIASGYKPNEIVAVVGAFHAPVLTRDAPILTDTELGTLRKRSCKLTLMPYSYFRLSSQSGYGAGNHAPAYFDLVWTAIESGKFERIPITYLSMIARELREKGTHRSTAEVIEGVRLARILSALHDGQAPTLRDLRDAAITTIAHGDIAVISEALAHVDVGTAIGELPKGISQTSIQVDFDRELTRLKLEKFRTTVKQDLVLDLRENRRVKSGALAFLDLRRSAFLHRLRVLGIGFAIPVESIQESTTWAEKWHVQWTPESEIVLVESVLLGETIELASAFKLKSLLESCTSIAEAADLVGDASRCALPSTLEIARARLQELSSQSTDFGSIAHAAYRLGQVIRYGDVRQYDPAPLVPLLEELFVQASLTLYPAASGDNQSAAQLLSSIDAVNRISLEHHGTVDEKLWLDRLHVLSNSSDRNSILSGYACSILLERGLLSNADLSLEVSRRLSPGISADLGAGWFEGLAKRSRHSLLARQSLWEEVDRYVHSLDDAQFRRALVFLRRALGEFSPHEKRHICRNLGEVWKIDGEDVAEVVERQLDATEQKTIDELNDFDFDDL